MITGKEYATLVSLLKEYKKNKSITAACDACDIMVDFVEELEDL